MNGAHGMGLHPSDMVDAVANVIIVVGYVIVPFTVLRYLPLTASVKTAGTLFFLTCALTHLGMAFDQHDALWMVVNHVVQAVAVVWFVIGFWLLLRAALRRVAARRAKEWP